MRIPTASILVLLLTAALAGCTDSVDTDSLPGASVGLGVSATLAVDMGLPAQTSYFLSTSAASDAGLEASGKAEGEVSALVEGSESLGAEAQAQAIIGDCHSWVMEESIKDDIAFVNDATSQVFATVAGVPTAAVTLTAQAVANGEVVTEFGSASLDVATAAQASATSSVDALSSMDPSSASQLIFDLPFEGQVIAEGTHLLLTICVDEGAGAMVRLDGPDAPSGIPVLDQEIQDTDGDGYGDSEERRHESDADNAESTPVSEGSAGNGGNSNSPGGSDPEQPTPTPGGSDPGSVGTDNPNGDPDRLPPEPVIAAFFLIICLALAGFALLRRPTV